MRAQWTKKSFQSNFFQICDLRIEKEGELYEKRATRFEMKFEIAIKMRFCSFFSGNTFALHAVVHVINEFANCLTRQ